MEQTGYGIPLVTKKYSRNAFEFLDFFLRVTIPFEFEIESEAAGDIAQPEEKTKRRCCFYKKIPSPFIGRGDQA